MIVLAVALFGLRALDRAEDVPPVSPQPFAGPVANGRRAARLRRRWFRPDRSGTKRSKTARSTNSSAAPTSSRNRVSRREALVYLDRYLRVRDNIDVRVRFAETADRVVSSPLRRLHVMEIYRDTWERAPEKIESGHSRRRHCRRAGPLRRCPDDRRPTRAVDRLERRRRDQGSSLPPLASRRWPCWDAPTRPTSSARSPNGRRSSRRSRTPSSEIRTTSTSPCAWPTSTAIGSASRPLPSGKSLPTT